MTPGENWMPRDASRRGDMTQPHAKVGSGRSRRREDEPMWVTTSPRFSQGRAGATTVFEDVAGREPVHPDGMMRVDWQESIMRPR
jgi:hypothetical protein